MSTKVDWRSRVLKERRMGANWPNMFCKWTECVAKVGQFLASPCSLMEGSKGAQASVDSLGDSSGVHQDCYNSSL